MCFLLAEILIQFLINVMKSCLLYDQGVIWVLELDESLKEKLPKEPKKKINHLEVHPVRKFARIKDHKLILTDTDSNKTVITLKGCSVEAVSGSQLPTRKWYFTILLTLLLLLSELLICVLS